MMTSPETMKTANPLDSKIVPGADCTAQIQVRTSTARERQAGLWHQCRHLEKHTAFLDQFRGMIRAEKPDD